MRLFIKMIFGYILPKPLVVRSLQGVSNHLSGPSYPSTSLPPSSLTMAPTAGRAPAVAAQAAKAGSGPNKFVRCAIVIFSFTLARTACIHADIEPLSHAAKSGDLLALEKLINENASIDAVCPIGKTALHYALENGHEQAAITLISHGAAINILDHNDNTPLLLARQKKLDKARECIERAFLSCAYRKEKFSPEDKHFVLLIASYNNIKWAKKNLDQLFKQTHKKWTAIYMDDMSDDGTSEFVPDYIKQCGHGHRVIYIKNKVKRYCLGNYLFAVERFCPDGAILITYDGDDFFPDKHSLEFLNKTYNQNPDIWLTYGNSRMHPSNIVTPFCKPISTAILAQKKYRQSCKEREWWEVHHLRSFYTWLFRQLSLEELTDSQGQLYRYAEDVAYMLGMIERSGPYHIMHIPKVLYIYNQKNILNTQKTVGQHTIGRTFKAICSKKSQDQLKQAAAYTKE